MNKKIISWILAAVMVLGVLPAFCLASGAEAERVTPTWTAGSTVSGALTNLDDGSASTRVDFNDWSTASGKAAARYWKLENGVLTVVGSGDLLSDSNTAYAGFPWYTRGAEIETVILIGFTTIGTGAFYSPQNSASYRNIKKFIIGEGTTTLNDSAFGIYSGSTATVDIYLPSTLTTINARAFRSIANYIGTVYASPALDLNALTITATNNPAKITSKDYTLETYTHLLSTAYDWENSNGATELKIGLKDASDNIPVSAADLNNYTWKVSIATHDYGKTIECTPSSVDANGVYRFRTCLGDGEDQFIPRYHIVSKAKTATDYSVQVDICDKTTGEVIYRSEYKSGFVCPTTLEPIYTEDHQGVYYLNGLVYIEGDLGDMYNLDRVEVFCYRGSTRYYKFAVVASNDNTLPASAWTWLGTQAADIGSTNDGYTVNITNTGHYRYIRIYPIGQYGAGGNSGYHFTDINVYGTVYVDPYARFGGENMKISAATLNSTAFETWPAADNGTWGACASFHALVNPSVNFSANLGNANYAYTWNVYVRETGGTAWVGPYDAKVETKSNSGWYRVQVSDCSNGADVCENFSVGVSYDILFDVTSGGEHQGFMEFTVTWTEKYNAYHDFYTDFWNNHDRSRGYTSGVQVVTDRDAAVAAALGIVVASNGTSTFDASKVHTHSFSQATVPATCVTTEKEAMVCTTCGMIGEVLSENANAEPIHKFGAWTATEVAGTQNRVCAYCGTTETRTIEPGYYFVGDCNNWELESAYKFTQFDGYLALKGVALTAGAEFKAVYTPDGVTKDVWYPGGNNMNVNDAGTYNFYLYPNDGTPLRCVPAKTYYMAGDPNGWSQTGTLLEDPDNDGVYTSPYVTFGSGEGFKITAGTWTWSTPANNWIVNDAGDYMITYNEQNDAIHVWTDWTDASAATFTTEGTKERHCICGCGATETETVARATLGVYDEVIVGENAAGKKTATVVGTITGEGLDENSADKMTYTLTFKQGDDIVKTVTDQTTCICTTVMGVASANESTAASQQVEWIEGATYLFAVRMVGIPAGEYTVEVTLGAVLGDTTVASYTTETAIAFTVD